MAPKNIDETIKKILCDYAKHCKEVLDKQTKELQKRKFFADEDRKNAIQEQTKAKHAYEFLLEIAEEPKKYLYSGKDLIYANRDLYDKLLPIMTMRFDPSGKHLLVRLSEKIAHHVQFESRYDSNGVWVYYGNSAVCDTNAESIIKMSKVVELWNDNSVKAAVKDLFVPTSMFAVDLYKKER